MDESNSLSSSGKSARRFAIIASTSANSEHSVCDVGGGASSDGDQLGGARSSCDEIFELSIRRVLYLPLLLLLSPSKRLGGFLLCCKRRECFRFLFYCA